MEENEAVVFEEFYQPLDTWFSVRAYPSEQGLAVYFLDITETRKRTEEMDFKNAILKTQQATSLDAMLVVDGNRQIISHNQQFIDLWRISPQMASVPLHAPVLQSIAAQTRNPEAFVARVQDLYAHQDATSRDELKLNDGRVVDRYSAPAIGPNGTYYGRDLVFPRYHRTQGSGRARSYISTAYTPC